MLIVDFQAPPEKRQVFHDELQRVGIEGAKVLRELGSKVEKMEKLSVRDILADVQAAAEGLQIKIDQQSFLLVNSKIWGDAKCPNKCKHVENLINDNMPTLGEPGNVSQLNIRISTSLRRWSSEDDYSKAGSWPCLPFHSEYTVYESASSLSLATFASLLIEFVARLQNLVDEFVELSEEANFRDP